MLKDLLELYATTFYNVLFVSSLLECCSYEPRVMASSLGNPKWSDYVVCDRLVRERERERKKERKIY